MCLLKTKHIHMKTCLWIIWQFCALLNIELPHTDTHTEVAQSCLTLCDPMDCRPPGSSVHGIFQTWILERVAVSFYNLSVCPKSHLNTKETFPAFYLGKVVNWVLLHLILQVESLESQLGMWGVLVDVPSWQARYWDVCGPSCFHSWQYISVKMLKQWIEIP